MFSPLTSSNAIFSADAFWSSPFPSMNVIRVSRNPVSRPRYAVRRSPPDADKTTSTFCPQQDFNGDDFLQFGSCCTGVQEAVIEAKYLEAGALSAGCSDLYKEVGWCVAGYVVLPHLRRVRGSPG